MGVCSLRIAIFCATAAAMCSCSSMRPATCAAIGSVVGASVGLVASGHSRQQSVITHHPGQFDPPGTPSVTVKRVGRRGISRGEGTAYGAVGGAAISYAVCRTTDR